MGCFYTSASILNVADPGGSFTIDNLLVDTGSEFTWVPGELLETIGVQRRKKDEHFQMANGETVTRSVGYAIVRVGQYETVDEVVFALPGDMKLLGARTMEGMRIRVDPGGKRLVAAGPSPAATAKFPRDVHTPALAPANQRVG